MKQGEEGNRNSGETFRISVGIPARRCYGGALTGGNDITTADLF